MIRLIGVLTGSALAVALLLLVLGVPELAGPPVADGAQAAAVNVEPVPGPPRQPPPEDLTELPAMEEAESLADTAAASGMESASVPAAEPEMTAPADPDSAPDLAASDTPAGNLATSDTPDGAEVATENWYAFWSPFRSRIAADGFVSELARTTGLDYRVVKLKPGVYEVAVAYTDDADIEDKLTRISAATGLDMSGG